MPILLLFILAVALAFDALPGPSYVEVAEDGSADRYSLSGDVLQSWPAGTAPATGEWTFCAETPTHVRCTPFN